MYISFYAPVALTLADNFHIMNLTYILWGCTCIHEMKFLGKGFQKLQHKQDKHTHTDRCD